ncbi:MAG: two-component sensor histidine kinase [Acidimicrobiaceae bacterium]|nr:two-component sensor histidine kinase [Acidimicrobiaceae bacterium]
MLITISHNVVSSWPPALLYAVGVAVLLLGVGVGILVYRRRGHRAIAQRLAALGGRLGVEPQDDKGKVEAALAHLEEVAGVATTVVTEAGADAVRLRRSLDVLPLGLVLCDEGGAVLYRNAQAERLMVSRYGDAIAAQAVTDTLADGWTNGIADRTIDIYGPPRRTLTIRAAVIDDGRRPLGVVAFIEDVSERRRLEDIRRDFIANVSHELKTPMGAMGLLAETLQFERDPVVANRLAERINSEAFRVNRIIEDLLDLSRIEGEGSPTREPVSVSLIVADALERIRIVAEQQNVHVSFQEPEIGYVIGGDRRQLVSAVQALLENAVEYSPDDGKVAIIIERVESSPFDDEAPAGPLVRVSIKDEGPGIPTKDLDRIFERFYRVDPGRARATGGTGLGLSIVRHVAQNHGGRVVVESREGEGSTFILELPVNQQ